MKKVVCLLIIEIALLSFVTAAPPDSIGTKSMNGKNFILHKVEPSEGWYSIARKYGISYAELRMANSDSSDKLVAGAVVMVPEEKIKANDPYYRKNYMQGQPLYYYVKEGETLFSIAKKFDTTVDSLKAWNELGSTDLKKEQRLLIGYKSGMNGKDTVVSEKPKEIPSAEKPKDTVPAKLDSTVIIKTIPKTNTTGARKTSGPAREQKEMKETGVAAWIKDEDINPNKYYALHRSAAAGTIVKVTNKMNKKYVFVKVIGALPDTGDNNELIIKISKASAEKLGVRDQKFQCELSYYSSSKD